MMKHGLILRDDATGAELLGRADVVKFDLSDGNFVEVPDPWVMAHDVVGKVIPTCDLRMIPYAHCMPFKGCVDSIVCRIAYAYFGRKNKLDEASIEIPRGPWHRLGRVDRIYYARQGKHKGLYHHPFKQDAPPVTLYERDGGGAYRLKLPPGCIVDSHGFVWP